MLVAPVTDSVVSTISMMTVMLFFNTSNSIQVQDSNTVRLPNAYLDRKVSIVTRFSGCHEIYLFPVHISAPPYFNLKVW